MVPSMAIDVSPPPAILSETAAESSAPSIVWPFGMMFREKLAQGHTSTSKKESSNTPNQDVKIDSVPDTD